FIDRAGALRDQTFGEGNYGRSERVIQTMLSEGSATISDPITDVMGEGAEAPPDWGDLQSPETYVGYAKAANFSPWGELQQAAVTTYQAASSLRLNHWTLSGAWSVGSEYATAAAPDVTLRFRFHARDLHLVLGRAPSAAPIRFRVTVDGQAPGADRGVDV